MTVPYGTDSNGFRPRGVKSYGIFPGIIPAASILSMHGDAEFMPIDALGPAIQILFEALKETASKNARSRFSRSDRSIGQLRASDQEFGRVRRARSAARDVPGRPGVGEITRGSSQRADQREPAGTILERASPIARRRREVSIRRSCGSRSSLPCVRSSRPRIAARLPHVGDQPVAVDA